MEEGEIPILTVRYEADGNITQQECTGAMITFLSGPGIRRYTCKHGCMLDSMQISNFVCMHKRDN